MMAVFVWTLSDIGPLVVLALIACVVVGVLLRVLYDAIRDTVVRIWRRLVRGCRHV